jgi:hypothetical protein
VGPTALVKSVLNGLPGEFGFGEVDVGIAGEIIGAAYAGYGDPAPPAPPAEVVSPGLEFDPPLLDPPPPPP